MTACAGVSMVHQEKPEPHSPPAVDLSMSPSSRQMPSSPELINENGSSHLLSGVSTRVQVLNGVLHISLSNYYV